MIEITKKESEFIREKFPNTHIHRTKHRYYCTEEFSVMRALKSNPQARAIVAKRNNGKRYSR